MRTLLLAASPKISLRRIVAFTLVTAGTLLSSGDFVAAAERAVGIRDDFFTPKNLPIQVGDTVKWTHQGSDAHTTTSNTGLWDSGVMHNGDTFSATFTNLGTFSYHCQVHGQSMSGSIIVTVDGPGAARDRFLVNLSGKSRTTNASGDLVMVSQKVNDFVEDCAEENTREPKDLALVYDLQDDAIEVVDRANGSNVCTVATFVGGVTLSAPSGTQRERQAFVIWEDDDEPSGSMVATERSTRDTDDQLTKFSLRGTIQLGLQAYEDEPPRIFAGTFSTGRRFVPTAQ